MRVLSRRKPLTISVSAPLRRTIAASGEPEAVMARLEADAHREHADQHRHDAGNAEDGRRHRAAPLRDAQQAELADRGDLRKPVNGPGHRGNPKAEGRRPKWRAEHGYILLRASATRRRMAWRAGKMPASSPERHAQPTPRARPRSGRRTAAACRRWGRPAQSSAHARPRPEPAAQHRQHAGLAPARARAPARW